MYARNGRDGLGFAPIAFSNGTQGARTPSGAGNTLITVAECDARNALYRNALTPNVAPPLNLQGRPSAGHVGAGSPPAGAPLVGFYTLNVGAGSFTASNANVLNLPTAVQQAALSLATANATQPTAATEAQAPYGYYLVETNLGATIRVDVYGPPAQRTTQPTVSNKTPVRRPTPTPSFQPPLSTYFHSTLGFPLGFPQVSQHDPAGGLLPASPSAPNPSPSAMITIPAGGFTATLTMTAINGPVTPAQSDALGFLESLHVTGAVATSTGPGTFSVAGTAPSAITITNPKTYATTAVFSAALSNVVSTATGAAVPPVTAQPVVAATSYAPYYVAAGVAAVGGIVGWLFDAARKSV